VWIAAERLPELLAVARRPCWIRRLRAGVAIVSCVDA
jgi:hypothetical protein